MTQPLRRQTSDEEEIVVRWNEGGGIETNLNVHSQELMNQRSKITDDLLGECNV